MRRQLAICAGLLAVTGTQLYRRPQADQAAAVVQVQVDVRCPAQRLWFTVNPWTASLSQGDEIEWVLNDSAGSSEITINAKQGGWPFAASPPYKGGRPNPPRGRNMKPNQQGRRFSYAIQLVCQRGGGTPDTVVIDPQIIVH